MRGTWRDWRDAVGRWMRRLAGRAGTLLRLCPAPAPPPTPELPPRIAAALAAHPQREALRDALRAPARIEAGPGCPALAPLTRLAAARGVRVEATILAMQGEGEARRARIRAMIAPQGWHDQDWRGERRCP